MPSFPCPVTGCPYKGQNELARSHHIQKRHPDHLKPVPSPPRYVPLPAQGNRAAIYLRVSTIDQHPENQLPGIRLFAQSRSFLTVGEPYIDKASGKNTNRPALQRLIEDAALPQRPFDVVLFRRMSRLGRSLRDNIGLFDYFQGLGVALISVEEPVDTTTPAGRFVRGILALAAEYERENLLEQIQDGFARARAEGKIVGRHRAGCGVLFPCPSGTRHAELAMIAGPGGEQVRAELQRAVARRDKEAAKKRKYREKRRLQLLGDKNPRSQGALAVGDTTPFSGA